VVSVGVLPVILTLSLFSPTEKSIERAFFQNDAKLIYALLSPKNQINISLPEPVSFSDQVSPEQAFFLFRQICSTFQTFEFYADTELPVLPKKNSLIFKARWSFKNRKSNNQYVLQVFFYLVKDIDWKITEIKAEKL
jgi:hypothetical protein